jgi:hypothetical protein
MRGWIETPMMMVWRSVVLCSVVWEGEWAEKMPGPGLVSRGTYTLASTRADVWNLTEDGIGIQVGLTVLPKQHLPTTNDVLSGQHPKGDTGTREGVFSERGIFLSAPQSLKRAWLEHALRRGVSMFLIRQSRRPRQRMPRGHTE